MVGFWACVIPANENHSLSLPAEHVLRISSVALAITTAKDLKKGPIQSSLCVKYNEQQHVIATMIAGNCPSSSLDLFFYQGVVSFKNVGNHAIHLSGYLAPPEEDQHETGGYPYMMGVEGEEGDEGDDSELWEGDEGDGNGNPFEDQGKPVKYADVDDDESSGIEEEEDKDRRIKSIMEEIRQAEAADEGDGSSSDSDGAIISRALAIGSDDSDSDFEGDDEGDEGEDEGDEEDVKEDSNPVSVKRGRDDKSKVSQQQQGTKKQKGSDQKPVVKKIASKIAPKTPNTSKTPTNTPAKKTSAAAEKKTETPGLKNVKCTGGCAKMFKNEQGMTQHVKSVHAKKE